MIQTAQLLIIIQFKNISNMSSARNVSESEKNMEAPQIQSQKHENKPFSSSKLASLRREMLLKEQRRIASDLEYAKKKLNFHKSIISDCQNGQAPEEIIKDAEEQVEQWRKAYIKTYANLIDVQKKLRSDFGQPKKPLRRRNLVSGKVQEPPSDNE